MGRDAFSADAFSRPSVPASGLHAPVKDRFKEKAEKLAARKGAKTPGDAFAGVAKPAARKDAFRGAGDPPPPVRAVAFVAAPKPQRTLANGASLKVVASQAQAKAEPVKREEKNGERKAAKSSSFVLVSSAAVVEATSPASPAVAGDGGQGPLVIPPLSSPKFRPTGGGGGGGGKGSGGGPPPPRDRTLNQDDLAGVLVVLAILLLLTLYFLRGNGAATDDSVLDIQSASAEPAVAPPAPLADPFGDQAVDLTPRSPPPPEPAVIAAAAPAPASAAIDVRVHAYFCTDRSELTPASAATLDKEIAAWGDRMAGKSLVVEGYADTRGEAAYNTWLGGERAKAVANYLTAKGFNATALGVGELADLTDNQNCANQRRVDVRLADAPSQAPSRSCAPPPELAALACLAEPRKPASSEQAQASPPAQ